MKKQRKVGGIILTVAFCLISLFWIMPIVQVLINSFKTNAGINLDVFGLPLGEAFAGFQN